MESPYVIVIGGPNGAGKSTLAKHLLLPNTDITAFVNADVIAATLTDTTDDQRNIVAGRRALELMDNLVERRASFAIESTLSGKTLAARLRSWRALGYRIVMHDVLVYDSSILERRIAHRVTQGGHNIPVPDQRRRLGRSIRNFYELYRGLSDECTIHDGRDDAADDII